MNEVLSRLWKVDHEIHLWPCTSGSPYRCRRTKGIVMRDANIREQFKIGVPDGCIRMVAIRILSLRRSRRLGQYPSVIFTDVFLTFDINRDVVGMGSDICMCRQGCKTNCRCQNQCSSQIACSNYHGSSLSESTARAVYMNSLAAESQRFGVTQCKLLQLISVL